MLESFNLHQCIRIPNHHADHEQPRRRHLQDGHVFPPVSFITSSSSNECQNFSFTPHNHTQLQAVARFRWSTLSPVFSSQAHWNFSLISLYNSFWPSSPRVPEAQWVRTASLRTSSSSEVGRFRLEGTRSFFAPSQKSVSDAISRSRDDEIRAPSLPFSLRSR